MTEAFFFVICSSLQRVRVRLFLLGLLGLALLSSSRYFDSVDRQQEDFHVFQHVLQTKEGILDLHLSEDSVNYYLNILQKELQKPQSALEQFKLYSEMVARLKGGHTSVMQNREVQTEWLQAHQSLPIDLYLVGRHLVTGKIIPDDYDNIKRTNYSRKNQIPHGSEILSIDSLTVPEMMAQIGRYLSSDEGSMDFKYYQASQMFDFYHHLALPITKDSVLVEYVTPDFDTNRVFLAPGKAPIHSMNERLMHYSEKYDVNERDFGKFKIVKNTYGYFRFKSFSASSGSEYDAFLKSSFEKIKREDIKYLVIDLRGNTGGVMQYDFIKYIVGEGVNIGRYVVSKPFKKSQNQYVRKINGPFLRYAVLSWQQKRKLRNGSFNQGIILTEDVDEDLLFDGKICVITDEGTFSSAAILACQLKTLGNATIIGRPAGGSFYAGNAGTLLVKLPYSGIEIAVNPNTFYSQLNAAEFPLEVKQPDVFLNPLILDDSDLDQFYFKEAVAVFND